MAWHPDDDDDPFGDLLRELERVMEAMAKEMDGMAGPHGRFDVSARGPGRSGRRSGRLHVDVHADDETLRLVADMPGVPKEAIQLRCDGERVTIEASEGGRDYDELVELPVPVDEASASASYRNGVLDVTFDRPDGERGETTIEID